MYSKPVHPILPQLALQLPVKPQGVQVGNGFAHGEGGLVQVQRAFEEHGQHVGGAAGRGGAGLQHLGQALAVVVVELFNAGVQAGEGFAMGGQRQGVRVQRLELVNGVEKQLEGIGLGLLVIDAHIGGNAGQHHVAAHQHLQFVAVQRDVLRRMAKAADAAPCPPANGERVAVLQASELGGHLRY